MENRMMEIKVAITAFFTAIGTVLGWQGIMAVVWVAAMLIDYISGTCAAMKAGEWCSKTAREGLWHKGGMIVVVVVAAFADLILGIICEHLPLGFDWTSIVLPLVLAWYIVTEMGSIIENAVKMGAAVPQWLVKLLKAGIKKIDAVGEQLEGIEEENVPKEEIQNE